ncbi:MAG TPA: hypothetical protein VGA61_14905 [Anaerolineae bacterium]
MKFRIGEPVVVLCYHRGDTGIVYDWLAGVVVEADARMIAVRFPVDVFTNQGVPVVDRTLWSAHGSPHVRRPDGQA